MKISVIGPVLNEVDFIGYSIMAAMPYVHEFIYALDEKSDDGTRELLHHLIVNGFPITIIETPTFHPSDMKAYNDSFNSCIKQMTGDCAWFLHPDMIVTEGPKESIPEGPMAWWVQVTSYARDFGTVITKGRTDKWKNIHRKTMGLRYFGGYGSQNEDFYHSDITAISYKHYGSEFSKYPYQVSNSGIKVNHYCELKDYARRLEKMKICLRELHPDLTDDRIDQLAVQHPRVTLEQSSRQFGVFEFTETKEEVPEVFKTYGDEFKSFKKELICG